MNIEEERQSLLQDEDDEQNFGSAQPQDVGTSTYEEAITATGYGKFHYKLLLLCGWAVSSDAIEVLCISFILPAATCDLSLSTSDKGWLNSSIFLGMMIGGYVWGSLADIYGRRSVLLWSLTTNAIGGLCSTFAQVFWLFLVLRIVSGIGVGGSMPVIFSYFTEFQPKVKRGSMISVLATFWMCGNIIAAGLAWLIIPQMQWGYNPIEGFKYNSWRIFLAVCIIPAMTSGILFYLMPESPKYLMENGKSDQAMNVLRKMFKSNNPDKDVHTDFQIEQLEVDVTSSYKSMTLSNQYSGGCCGKVSGYCKSFRETIIQLLKSTVELYKPPLTSVSIIMSIIFTTLSFGYYGLWMWFPELFARIEKYGGSPCSPPANASIPIVALNSTCDSEVSTQVYFDGFLTSASNLPGNILTILLIDHVGRKLLLSSSMVLSGISVFFIWFLKNKTQSLVMSCVFGGISVIGWNALDVLGAELFPTNLRSTANGVMMGYGRIAAVLGNTVFGQLVDVNCAIPMLLVAGFLTFGGLISLKLPNSTKADLK